MKKWELQNELRIKNKELRIDDIIKILLENRGIKTKREKENYLSPKLESLTYNSLQISEKDLKKSLTRIKNAIEDKEQIVIFGDYDVDGIAGSAILWETLNDLGSNVMPYIPHRIEEGYGLSKKGIENLLKLYPKTKLIITVDNGIVAMEAVDFGNSLGLEIIITDHHVPDKKLPKAFAIVHSTKICGAAVAWFLSQGIKNKELRIKETDHLGLVALATVTDVMPLTNFNRTLLKFGLLEIRKTKRPGLVELSKLAAIEQGNIGVYELGHVIGPRLNAMGRIEHAMDSLRFLCTKNLSRAKELANKLHLTNRERQQLTFDSVEHAKTLLDGNVKKLIFIADKSYQPGVIGLISGRITEEFYKPSIVISVGEKFSKASARSIKGFNIIEFIRRFSDLLVDYGGHPMASGFTVLSKNIEKLKKSMEEAAQSEIKDSLLVRKLKIDCKLPIKFINQELFREIQSLAPFGYGNLEPIFLAKSVEITDLRLVGLERKHLKLFVSHEGKGMEGIAFGFENKDEFRIGDRIDIVYSISQNEWNGNKKLELKIKDLKKN